MENTAFSSPSSDDQPSNISSFSVSSSSSSSPSETAVKIDDDYNYPKKYDVFLSFRGEDTRKNIMGHLRAALSEKGIKTFADDDQIERGQRISPQLARAIEESHCAVVILSQNYAWSTWCLDELVMIMDCMKARAQVVIPVFYHVDPSHVRKQVGNFGRAFAKHEKRSDDGSAERVKSWRAALTEVSSLAGLDIKNYRDEASFIREIVAEVSRKLSSLAKAEILEDYKRIEKKSLLSSCVSAACICSGLFIAKIVISLFVILPLFGFLFFRVAVPLFERVVFGGDPFGYLDSRLRTSSTVDFNSDQIKWLSTKTDQGF